MEFQKRLGLSVGGLVWGLVCLGVGAPVGAAPVTVPYVGELRGPSGIVFNGPVDVMAAIYPVSADGVALWGPTSLGTISVDQGRFELLLGTPDHPPLDDAWLSSDDLWLELSVDGETLAPRQAIHSVPFARLSADAGKLGGIDAADYVTVAQLLAHPVKVPASAMPPTDPGDGAMWFDTTTEQLAVFSGGSWVVVSLPEDVAAENITTINLVATGTTTVADMAIAGPLPFADVRAYGAKGDGVNDDTAAILAAIAAVPDSGTVLFPAATAFYRISAPIVVDHAVTLKGDGATVRQVTANTQAIRVLANKVRIEGLTLQGIQYANGASLERAIEVMGANAASPISDIRISRCSIENFGFYGIYLQFADGFLIENNELENLYYAGVMVLSGKNGRIVSNRIQNVVAAPNAYGIALTRTELDSLVEAPPTTDVVVAHNVVTDIPHWEAYDTHGGRRLVFANNVARNVKMGIQIGASDDSSNNPAFAPQDITVVGNVLDSGKTDGTTSYGIAFTGAAGTLGNSVEKATGTITGNVIRHFGLSTSNLSTAVYLRDTHGVAVVGNTIVEPATIGINVYHDNTALNIIGNTIIDPWSQTPSNGFAPAVALRAEHNQVRVDGNSFLKGLKLAPSVLVEGVRVDGTANQSLSLGQNRSEALYAYIGSTNHLASTIFRGKVGINEPSPQVALDVAGAVKADVFGRVVVSQTLAAGATSPIYNLNGQWAVNGNVYLMAILFSSDSTTASSDNSFMLVAGAHGGPYNHYTILAQRASATYEIQGSMSDLRFKNNSGGGGRYTIKMLPLLTHSTALVGQ